MKTIKNLFLGFSFVLLPIVCFGQKTTFNLSTNFGKGHHPHSKISKKLNSKITFLNHHQIVNYHYTRYKSISIGKQRNNKTGNYLYGGNNLQRDQALFSNLTMSTMEKEPFLKNRRNVYSSLWAYASLNYLYADLVGLMDAHVLAQYQNGEVDGTKITPQFLSVAAVFMQIPLANVFLPQVIKNDKTLRWVQIASGSIMTLVQAGTLFVGEPTPYYAIFSLFEMAATSYITIDAIKWKPMSKENRRILNQ